ncbi:MAG TPA: hypothetical protein VJX67_03960 [Blastocatellia bacterium]|nr:hypothetical protein [Blastocatellia bacterium]
MTVSQFSDMEMEFLERVHKMVWCNMATQDSRRRIRSRVMHPIWEGPTCWIGTRRHSLKAKHLAQSSYVSLAYIADVAKPIYADCTAEWADGVQEKEHVWELFRSAPAPLGFDYGTVFGSPSDSEFGVLS